MKNIFIAILFIVMLPLFFSSMGGNIYIDESTNSNFTQETMPLFVEDILIQTGSTFNELNERYGYYEPTNATLLAIENQIIYLENTIFTALTTIDEYLHTGTILVLSEISLGRVSVWYANRVTPVIIDFSLGDTVTIQIWGVSNYE